MLPEDLAKNIKLFHSLPPKIRKEIELDAKKEQIEFASRYWPEDLKKQLQLWNFYNPVIVCKVLACDGFSIRTDKGGPIIEELNDRLAAFEINNRNKAYFEAIEAFWNATIKKNPILILQSLFRLQHGPLSHTYDEVAIYNSFLNMAGVPFDNCQIFEASSPLIPNVGTGEKQYKYVVGRKELLEYDFPGIVFTPLDEIEIRPKDIVMSKFEDELKIRTEDIPGLNFKNPWSRAIGNEDFTTTTIEQAEECLRNRFFVEKMNNLVVNNNLSKELLKWSSFKDPIENIRENFKKEISLFPDPILSPEDEDIDIKRDILENYPYDYFDGYRNADGNINLIEWMLSATVKCLMLEKAGIKDIAIAESQGKLDHIPEEYRYREKDSEWWKAQVIDRAYRIKNVLEENNTDLASSVILKGYQIKRQFRLINEPELCDEILRIAEVYGQKENVKPIVKNTKNNNNAKHPEEIIALACKAHIRNGKNDKAIKDYIEDSPNIRSVNDKVEIFLELNPNVRAADIQDIMGITNVLRTVAWKNRANKSNDMNMIHS